MTDTSKPNMQSLLDARYSDAPLVAAQANASDLLHSMTARGSCRSFRNTPVPSDLVQTLCAVALAAPSKSDLQQRDIILVSSKASRAQMAGLVAGQAWVADAPLIAVFCGNNRRQRLLHDWHKTTFANDHLDAFFNAAVDAGIALAAFVTAAEAVGLGCCPISAVRNQAQAVSEMLDLPDHVFPVAGLAIGYPDATPQISKRLPLAHTVHLERYGEAGLQDAVKTYDDSRAKTQPYAHQRFVDAFGSSASYGWSIDKTRQYSQPERDDFGAFVRAKGFRLD